MEGLVPRPDTVNKLRFAVGTGFAMLAGMQLDVFTPLSRGPKSAEDIAHAIAVGPARLRLLLYSLVAAGLLTEEQGRFSEHRAWLTDAGFVRIERANFLLPDGHGLMISKAGLAKRRGKGEQREY